MSSTLLGVNIAQLVHQSMSAILKEATLIKVTNSTTAPTNPTAAPTATETSYAARGFIEDYTERQFDSSIIRQGDRKVVLIGDSIAQRQVPQTTDKVTIEGRTYRIVNVARDPAGATYTLQVR